MKRIICTYIAVCALFVAAWQSFAQVPMTGAGLPKPAVSASYQGPGDLSNLGTWTAWGSCARAWNAAYAAAQSPLCDLVDTSTGVATCTLSVGTNGFANVSSAVCVSNTVSVTTFCTVTHTGCSVTKVYDQSGSSNHFTQATLGNMPTLTLSALNSLPGLTFAAGSMQINTGSITQAVPFSISSVYERTGGFTTQTGVVNPQNATTAGCGPYSTAATIYVGAVTGIAASDSAYHALQCVNQNTGGTVVSVVDGTTSTGTAGATGFVATPARMARGTGGSLTGIIMELGIWSGAFTSTEYGALNTNQHSATNGYNF
jgi:hypothetical protein